MICRLAGALVAVAVLTLAASSSALAQGVYQGRSDNPNGPTVSPYLNLLQNNSVFSPATNYQSLVKPLIDQNSAIRRQGGAINQLQQQVNSGPGSGGGGTGRGSYFMYYSHFYPNGGGGRR
ncbi:MAG: hypothetical protein AB7O59_23165 [Pirellulales bacterium]